MNARVFICFRKCRDTYEQRYTCEQSRTCNLNRNSHRITFASRFHRLTDRNVVKIPRREIAYYSRNRLTGFYKWSVEIGKRSFVKRNGGD